LATVDTPGAFLPRPRVIFDAAPELGPEVRYIDPFTGTHLVIRRKPKSTTGKLQKRTRVRMTDPQ
jgi:hypothetical protein